MDGSTPPLSYLRPDANSGAVALITGGGTGIGFETARQLAATGAAVVICGRRPEPLRVAAERIESDGGRCLAVVADIREPDEVSELLDASIERFGSIDVLVNNAGGQFAAPAEQITDNGWHAVQRLAVEGSWRVTRAVATRAMIPGSGGLIVFVGFSPLRGSPGFAHASAADQRLWSWRARRAPTSPARRSRSTGASTHGVLGSFRRRRPGERS
jgi:citronellol/citronellal dehydrogenase